MKKYLLILTVFIFTHSVLAQTNPTPLSLPVLENFGTTTFLSPKTGMASWTGDGARPYSSQTSAEASLGGQDVTIIAATPASGNAGGQYGYTVSGDGKLGILQSNNSTSGTTQVVMAINSTGIPSIQVSFDLSLSVSSSRDFGIALQYRIGTSSNFTTVSSSAFIYNSTSTNAGDADGVSDWDHYSFILPNDAGNNANVQLRWITWRPSGSGTSCGVSIDNISIISAPTNPCTEPTAQPTNLLLTPAGTTVDGSFTSASPAADGYLIVRSTSSSLSAQPVDGTSYTNGQALGVGTVVASGSSTSFTATGLSSSTPYYFFIYSYNNNNCTGGPDYFITTPLSGNTTTLSTPACVTPAAAPTDLSLTAAPTSISGTFAASATANRYLTVISSANTLSVNPANGTTYSAGQSLGGGTVVAYGSGTSFSAIALSSNTTYYFFVFAASGDCTGEPVYFATALSGSKVTTGAGNLPAGYYNAANGLTCSSLKTAVSTIISTGVTTISYDGLWDAYYKTDVRRNDANTATVIWDMYSDNPNGPDPYTFIPGTNQCGNYNSESDCYNREHSFPKSWFNDASPMYSDINHLYPTDGYVNNRRGNYPFGETSSPTYTSFNGSKVGPSSFAGYSGTVFEPINDYKGDFARAQFYMVTRYQSQVAGWQSNGTADEVLNGTSYQAFDDWYLKLMYKWHLQDPVSQKEINRNDSVFVIQGNRNPYIDHPEWVAAVWNCTGLLETTGVNDILNVPQNSVLIYPNPVTNKIATIKFDKPFAQDVTVQVIDITGKIMKQQRVNAGQTAIQLHTTELKAGIYSAKVNTGKGIITRTFIVQ